MVTLGKNSAVFDEVQRRYQDTIEFHRYYLNGQDDFEEKYRENSEF